MRCRGLTFRHPSRGFVLGPLDLEGPDDRLWLILGRSGSGKSTLLRLLCGALEPSGGSVEGPARDTVAYLPQLPERALAGRNLAEDLTGRVRPAQPERARLRDALHAAGLPGVPLSRRSRDLSLGERRRVALAMLLLSGRPHWGLDEPDAGLDRMGGAQLRALLEAHPPRPGAGRWIATFRLELYAPFDPWTVVLEGGRPAATGSLGAVIRHPEASRCLGLDARPTLRLLREVTDRIEGGDRRGRLFQMQALLQDRLGGR